MGDVDAFLALGIGRDHGAVGVDESFLKELGGLLGPDAEAGFIDGVHQGLNVDFVETAAEVPFGGRVGNAPGAEGVEKDLVIAPQLDMLEPPAAGEDVEGDVQDMVGLVIGEMHLEQMEIVINVADQARPLSQQQHGADAAGGNALDALAQLVMDIGGGDHGLSRSGPGRLAMRSRILRWRFRRSLRICAGDFLQRLRLGTFFGTITITRNPP